MWWDLLFFLITAVWLMEFVLFRDRKPKEGTKREKQSFVWIAAAVSGSVIISVTSRELVFFRLQEHGTLLMSGLLLYSWGVALRYWGILKLGRMFSRDVAVESAVDLVSSGPYRTLRHPLYTALLFCTAGIALYMGSAAGLAAVIVFVLPALLIRMKLEERMLTDALGEGYQTWCSSRYRFIPYVY
ncbi:methyltransferase family protein [Alteribacter natronophilus]|uniref:methyltransferase family protein n=1 Tax=Alteribacter natronophilus TaxID=2583810 RepID=UPI00110D656A|nr:isoprenylcysteine carboxylmethyltransferase family protein [Alteribacter natronophilus]TMW73064.1 isoprenylcysteine carboxylmethyltransferase family protein [Alteribacter natronophilus]